MAEGLSKAEIRKIRGKVGAFLDADDLKKNIYVTSLLVKMANEDIGVDDALNGAITDPSCTEEHIEPYKEAADFIRDHADDPRLKKIKI